FGRNVELRRTISSRLGENAIDFVDEFTNLGNGPAPHAWLLHINLGYPLVQEGREFCYDSPKVEPTPTEESQNWFKRGGTYKTAPSPQDRHRGFTEAVAYLYPRASRDGQANGGVAKRKLALGLAIGYNTC